MSTLGAMSTTLSLFQKPPTCAGRALLPLSTRGSLGELHIIVHVNVSRYIQVQMDYTDLQEVPSTQGLVF